MAAVPVDDEIHKEFKIICAKKGYKMKQITNDLIKKWNNKHRG